MAKYIAAQPYIPNSGTAYSVTDLRTWIGQVRAALSGVGLVQTSDTGQLNPATVTSANINTMAGYEIWRFSDAAQATDPVFLRIEYWRNNSTSAYDLRVGVGQGSNGSGTLTGTNVNPSSATGSRDRIGGGSGSGEIAAYFGDGIFWLADGLAATASSFLYGPRNFFLIARTRNDAGALDARGVFRCILAWQPNTANWYGFNNYIQLIRWAPGSELVHPATGAYMGMVNSALNPVAAGSGYLLAWPLLYYEYGVGVKQAQFAFGSKRDTGSPVSVTGFDADPFGLGSRRWCTWRWSPSVSTRANTTYQDSYTQVNLPWEV